MSYVVDTNCGNASIHFNLVACARSPQTSSISFESSGKEAWVLKMSKWSEGNRKWYSLCGLPCDSSFYVVFHSTSEGTGGILAWEYSRHTSLNDGGKLRRNRSKMGSGCIRRLQGILAVCFIYFIPLYCIVLHFKYFISFHFISCCYILRSEQTDHPLGLLLSLYFLRNGDLGYTREGCPKEERV